MRYLLFAFASLLIIQTNGQTFVNYKDTINHFSINLPSDWKYGVNKSYPTIKLLAYRIPANKSDTSKHNLNVNIFEAIDNNLDKTFADFSKNLSAGNLKMIDKGDKVINGSKFKWLIETHQNGNNGIQMHNFDFVALKNGKVYILTMVTFSNSFATMKPLFDTIANSFILLN